jgi:hypothetical protein
MAYINPTVQRHPAQEVIKMAAWANPRNKFENRGNSRVRFAIWILTKMRIESDTKKSVGLHFLHSNVGYVADYCIDYPSKHKCCRCDAEFSRIDNLTVHERVKHTQTSDARYSHTQIPASFHNFTPLDFELNEFTGFDATFTAIEQQLSEAGAFYITWPM